ncbi:uncharacterized protein RHO25_005150 [Cercospora beticola]|uniref:Peptidase S74 domain-containing protein n=1 Tax=Cercospora beticola TaxID=122368 RepID=A0ABZ0NM12_CERBT|nr:hypothetical protein RHO25_005150 [Cercospora beticola]
MDPTLRSLLQTFVEDLIFMWIALYIFVNFAHRFQNWGRVGQRRYLLDSGAASHATWASAISSNYRAYRMPRACAGVTGSAFILGVGDATVPFVQRDGTVQEILVPGVSYMPQTSENLLSTELLGKQGIMWSSEDQLLYRKYDDGSREEVAATEIMHAVPWLKAPDAVKKCSISDSSRKPGFWSNFWQRVVLGKGLQIEDDLTHWDTYMYADNVVDKLIDMVSTQQRELAALKARLEHVSRIAAI